MKMNQSHFNTHYFMHMYANFNPTLVEQSSLLSMLQTNLT